MKNKDKIKLKDFKIKVERKKIKRKRNLTDRLFDIEDHVKRNVRGGGKIRTKKEIRLLRRKIKNKRRKVVGDALELTKTGLKIDENELIASICRDSFFEFVKEFWHCVVAEQPVWNWHIEYLCNELQTIAERVFKDEAKEYDLVTNIPPGTTKSTIMSVMYPAWIWTRMPSARFIGASHSDNLSLDLSIKCRDIIKSDKYRACYPEIQLREDQDTKTKFQNTKGGYRYAVGVSGSVIGMHAHFIVLDDPIDALKATSAAEIKKVNYWIDNQLSNRKVSKSVSVMILVMQRLHQEDPTTLFLKRKKIKHICLPAERSEKISPPELRKYYTKLGGRLLDPVRLTHENLAEEKRKGQYYYSSQFMQDPVPLGGGMFKVKRVKPGRVPTSFKKVVRYWDKGGTAGGGAFTVGTKMGLDFDGRFWVLDVIRTQLDSFEREALMQRTAQADGKAVKIGLEQEPGSGGKESAESSVRRLAGYSVTVQRAAGTAAGGLGGKVERADPFSVQMNAGNVYIPDYFWNETIQDWKEGTWVLEWLDEHRYFPNSKYKDQVDSSSGAFSLCYSPVVRVGGMLKGGSGKGMARKDFLKLLPK